MIKSKVKIKDIDKGYSNLKKHVPGKVDIGILGDQDSKLVIISATHEFGTKKAGRGRKTKIPERSFLRATFDNNKKEIVRRINKSKIDLVTKKINRYQLLKLIGLFFQSKARARITNSKRWAEQNKPSTLKRKKPYTRPLFAGEDRIKKSITYRIK